MSSASAINDIKADQIVAGIREWVALETPPHDVKRLTEFSELATHQAKQAGLTVDTIPVGDSKQPLVRIRAPSDNNEKSVLVLAHYDTVHPVGTVERNSTDVAAAVKTMQGNSLTAVLTATGMVEPMLPALGLDSLNGRVLAALSAGADAPSLPPVAAPAARPVSFS